MTRVALPAALLRLPLAHRGLHDRAAGRIENSPSAIAAAVGAGYGIEMDLQLSKDGVAMVFHDDALDRLTTASGPLRERTAAELGRIGLTGGTDCIPTLAEVLAMVAGRAPLLLELKDQSLRKAGTDGRLEASVAAGLAAYRGDVAAMSYNPDMVAELARVAPSLPRGITTSSYGPEDSGSLPETHIARLRAIVDYDRTGASFISHEARDLARPRVADLKAQGAAILCWTVRSPEAEVAARRHAQNITFEGYAAAIPA